MSSSRLFGGQSGEEKDSGIQLIAIFDWMAFYKQRDVFARPKFWEVRFLDFFFCIVEHYMYEVEGSK